VNSEYDDGRHAFDWVILDLFLVIECHGEQHYKPVTFGGISQEEANERLISQRYRDEIKAQAAIDAGFTYIVIPYTDYGKVDDEYIWQLYKECFNPDKIPKEKKAEPTDWELEQKERAREYRQEQYRRQKEHKRRLKDEL